MGAETAAAIGTAVATSAASAAPAAGTAATAAVPAAAAAVPAAAGTAAGAALPAAATTGMSLLGGTGLTAAEGGLGTAASIAPASGLSVLSGTGLTAAEGGLAAAPAAAASPFTLTGAGPVAATMGQGGGGGVLAGLQSLAKGLNEYGPAINTMQQLGSKAYEATRGQAANPLQLDMPDMSGVIPMPAPPERTAFLRAFGIQG